MSQVNNVSQLRDVQPGDWAYEALRSLIERYGVIAGYPDGTFRGNRPMSRYEFAAGLKVALDQISQLLTTRASNTVTRQDLALGQRLREEFALELALLRGRVDAVTARIGDLERTQFSTTTKLQGEVIFGVASVAGEDATGNDIDNATVLGHRSRLNLETSFTGQDILRTRLQAEGLASLSTSTLTPEGDLAFAGDSDSDLKVEALLYQFPLSKNTEVVLAANAGAADDFANTVNPYLDGDGAAGALSNFGTRHPIYYLVEGAGVGVRHAFSNKLELSLGYLANEASNPREGGLFNGPYGALAQLVFQPSEKSSIGLTYVHAYNNDTGTGSNDANLVTQLGLPAISNSYGVEASFQISPRFAVGGWAGYTAARVLGLGDATIWNWALTLAFPDLGKKGNLGGIVIGMEPKVTRQDSSLRSLGINDPDTSLHLEAFYQYNLTDNIAVTPGIIWLTAPDHNNDNDDVVIGTVRTTFSF
ncbi:MAG: iron uptake porin [Aphanothece sp. CMT-3BRIN-NPC111]|nr:iron uptake porin [Aphanothece sp. CMT-3BRIN-NPC111]